MNLPGALLLSQAGWVGVAAALYALVTGVGVLVASTVSCRASASFLIVTAAAVASVLVSLPQLTSAAPWWFRGSVWAAVTGCVVAAGALMARPDRLVKVHS